MARTWTDTAADAARARRAGCRTSPVASSAIAVTGQGDGTWLIDATASRSAPAWLWLDARAAAIVARDSTRSRRTRALIEHTGSGLNACQQRPQLVWLKRHAPELLGRAATAFHCKDWLYFKLTGERAHRSLRRRPSPSATSAPAATCRRCSTRSGSPTRAPAAADRRRQPRRPHRAAAAAAARDRAAGRHCRSCSAMSTSSAPASAAALRAAAGLGCSIVGSTGMHMRFVADADRAAARPGADRLHHGVPGAGQRTRRCSRTWRRRSTSTGCSTWRARRAELLRAPRSTAGRLLGDAR